MPEPTYILFEDGIVIGPFDPDEKLGADGRGSLPDQYVSDQGWDDLAYQLVTRERLPEDIEILPPVTQAVTVNLRLIGLAQGVDPRRALTRLFEISNAEAETAGLPTIHLSAR